MTDFHKCCIVVLLLNLSIFALVITYQVLWLWVIKKSWIITSLEWYLIYLSNCVLWLDYDEFRRDEFSFENRQVQIGVEREVPMLPKLGSSSVELHPKSLTNGEIKPIAMPPTSVMTRLILIMVWRKLIRNPNTYSSLFGLAWSLVSYKYESFLIMYWITYLQHLGFFSILSLFKCRIFRWDVEMPAIIAKSIAILSDAGLGMAMFSLGMFQQVLVMW